MKRLWLGILIILSVTVVSLSCGCSSAPAEIIDIYVGGLGDIVVKVAPNEATRGEEYYRVCLYIR
jgi:hypothetical protein